MSVDSDQIRIIVTVAAALMIIAFAYAGGWRRGYWIGHADGFQDAKMKALRGRRPR